MVIANDSGRHGSVRIGIRTESILQGYVAITMNRDGRLPGSGLPRYSCEPLMVTKRVYVTTLFPVPDSLPGPLSVHGFMPRRSCVDIFLCQKTGRMINECLYLTQVLIVLMALHCPELGRVPDVQICRLR